MTLGRLTHEQALELHTAGYSRAIIAQRADRSVGRVGEWRRRFNLSRSYGPTGLSRADRRAYQREWKRLRRAARTT